MYKTFVIFLLFIGTLNTSLVYADTAWVPPVGGYCPFLTLDLMINDTDATKSGQVTELQKFLTAFFGLVPQQSVTGTFSTSTETVVKQFQQLYNMSKDGKVTAPVRAKITEVCRPNGQPPGSGAGLSCTFSGRIVQSGESVTAYQFPIASASDACISETRTCLNGALTGSYENRRCTQLNGYAGNFFQQQQQGSTASCRLGSLELNDGGSAFVAYRTPTVPAGSFCEAEIRTCSPNGLSGSYAYPYCVDANGQHGSRDTLQSVSENSCLWQGDVIRNRGRVFAQVIHGYNGNPRCFAVDIRRCENGSISQDRIITSRQCRRGQNAMPNYTPANGGSTSTTNASCTFANTAVGQSCGGRYHCVAGVNYHYWGQGTGAACVTAR